MPIELDDPDEVDGRRGPRRRRWVAGAALLVGVGAGAAAVVLLDDDPKPAATSPVDSVPSTPPATDEVVIPQGPPPPQAFPDMGSDYLGEKLEVLFDETNEAGIRVTLQDLGGFFGFPRIVNGVPEDIAAEGAIGMLGAEPGDALADVILAVPAPPEDIDGWQPAGWCNPSGGVRVTMRYRDSVNFSQGSAYTELRNGVSAQLFSGGQAEATPFRVLVLQVDPGVTAVSAEWADGELATSAPQNGWVALSVPGWPDGRFTITLRTDAGEEVREWQDLLIPFDGPEWRAACQPPPPELPPPGEVQPDDPAAAEQAIRDRFALLVDFSVPPEDKPDGLVDDPTGLDEAAEQLRAGGFAETAATARYDVTEVVFVSDTEAWFRYDLYTDVTNFTDRFGIAYFIDGEWRISRRVICQDYALAGVQCNPPAEPIIPG